MKTEKKKYVEKKVAMSETTYNQLNSLNEKRKDNGNVIYKNKDIIAHLVDSAFKKEVK